MIYVIATITLKEGQRDAFLNEFHQLVPQVRAEEGCIEYGPAVDLETTIGAQGEVRPHVATILEKWESLEALQAHLVAPHMLEYRTKVKSMVQNTALQILEPA